MILKGITTLILFILTVALLIAATLAYNKNSEFVSAFEGGVKNSFYISTVIILIGSSIIYTPISIGVSTYFIKSAFGLKPHFLEIFYLFKYPVRLFKGIAMNAVKSILILLQRLFILFVALTAELVIFFITVLMSGENIFVYENNFLSAAADLMRGSKFFIIMTIVEWAIVILLMLFFKVRFIFCKYAFIRFENIGVIEAIRIGLVSVKGHQIKTLLYYIRYISENILIFCTFGLVHIENRSERFSVYAVRMVEHGQREYYKQRSGH